jgi:TonB family protein
MSRKFTRGSLCGYVLLFGLAVCGTAAAQFTDYIVMRETLLRKRATRVVMPAYPARARKLRAKGVAVGEVMINSSGEVVSAKALEAPDESIEKELAEALMQWRFEPVIENGVSHNVKGKLTFYYVMEGGKFFVKNPRQF